MADEPDTNAGSIPDPIPEVRDEGPGGSDLSFTEAGSGDSEGTGGSLPHPVPQESTEDASSTD